MVQLGINLKQTQTPVVARFEAQQNRKISDRPSILAESAENEEPIKNLGTTLKSGCVALVKIGVVGAACYGAYKWLAGDVVHINDFMTAAKNDFAENPLRTDVPSSVVKLCDSFYDEQNTFRKWPKSGQEFFADHLASDAPMSSAIVKHLAEKAAGAEDFSFQRFAIQTCRKVERSSASCLTALDSFTDAATVEGLRNAMGITNQCGKSDNAFCQKAMRKAEDASVAQNSEPDRDTLLGVISRKKIAPGHRDFIHKAIGFSEQTSEKQERAVEDCRQYAAKKDDESWDVCFSHANFIEKLEGLDRQHSDWWKNGFALRKKEGLQKEHTEWLSAQANTFSGICSQIPDSNPCHDYSRFLLMDLLENGLTDDAMKFMKANGASLGTDIWVVLTKLANDGKWHSGVQFIVSFLKAYPDSDIRKDVDQFWRQLLHSKDASAAIDLLSLKDPIEVEKTLKMAFVDSSSANQMKLFKLAKTWIEANDKKQERYLILIIDQFFSWGANYYSWNNLADDMAKVLVTKWLRVKDPNDRDLRHLLTAYSLRWEDSFSLDSYSSAINYRKWKQKLGLQNY